MASRKILIRDPVHGETDLGTPFTVAPDAPQFRTAIPRTSKAEYSKMFSSLADSIRRKGVEAPIYASIETKCGIEPTWTQDNPIATAQESLVDQGKKIFRGVDTDTLLGPLDRYDDCHFSQTGQEKFANSWVNILSTAH